MFSSGYYTSKYANITMLTIQERFHEYDPSVRRTRSQR
jgi:hypothetical protein